MDSNEQYVREKWEDVDLDVDIDGSAVVTAGFDIDEFQRGIQTTANSESAAWQAAADFTRAHEKKISDVEEEIRYLQITADEFNRNERDWETWGRILAARQAALTERRKGWKG